MKDTDIVKIKKGNAKPFQVTGKVFRVLFEDKGYKLHKEANSGKARSKQEEKDE